MPLTARCGRNIPTSSLPRLSAYTIRLHGGSRTLRRAIRRRCCGDPTVPSFYSRTVVCRSVFGILPKMRGKTIDVQPDSYLVLYTDGLTEASRRPADGEDRVRDLLRDHVGGTGAEQRHSADRERDR
jgi:hypothetical protein